MSIYKVAAHTGADNNGYIQYDTESKRVDVFLNDTEYNRRIYEYLTKPRALKKFTGLSEYEVITDAPNASLELLKIALGKIWQDLGVHMDWSRPVE
ncbi:hypothetical protein [Colibacter massiliensis]|uniref:hypothetical protein n=1 Tax=Colibacter massiliensis TaxID=1852379 RepID=UPI002353CE36|nr:hypothetical protein [Colibacter massiliensis]